MNKHSKNLETSNTGTARHFALLALALCSTCGLGQALAATDGKALAFTSQGVTYTGHYVQFERALSVTIDGLHYRGHYVGATQERSAAVVAGGSAQGEGHAFLFASSAQVLNCRLHTTFPQVSGTCLATDGRQFELRPVTDD